MDRLERKYNDVDKLGVLEQELAYRKDHYPTLVEKGLASFEWAERQIAIVEEIAAEYRERVAIGEIIGSME
jgi:hypothetical protein